MNMRDRLRARIDGVHFSRFRFWVQAACFALIVYGGHLGLFWGRSLPVLACGYGGANRLGICYLMPLQAALDTPWQRWTQAFAIATLIGFLVFCAWFLVFNRTWCGFACPFGTLQDWISALRRRLGLRGTEWGDTLARRLSRLRYLLLGFAILYPLGAGAGWLPRIFLPFCQICPAKMITPLFSGEPDTLSVDFSSAETQVMTAIGMAVTGLFVAGAFVKKRFWCFFCPMGALQYLISRPAPLRLIKDGDKCTRCGDCVRVCDMNIQAIADDVVSRDIMTEDCILCLKCVAACPEVDALKLTFLGKTVFAATDQGFVSRMDKDGKP
jgi:polyferredoxin